ncbi:hypothetical protein AGMMS49521_4100 [Campylobacterota bacterium]|nr:hypothetical protein AGMMS49521_4100 [Campylobacterota bacterium]
MSETTTTVVNQPLSFNDVMGVFWNTLTKNYATFSGTASRREFWIFFFVSLVIEVLLIIIFPVLIIYYLATFCPTMAISARRVRDAGYDGKWGIVLYAISLITSLIGMVFLPFSLIGLGTAIALIVMCAQPSVNSDNKLNENPPHTQTATVAEKQAADNPTKSVKELYEIKTNGALSDEEYASMKARILIAENLQGSAVTKIKELKELCELGAITEDEFAELKSIVLR